MTSTAAVDPTNCDREPIHLLGAIQPTNRVFAGAESALELIDGEVPTLAVLDINLGDQTSLTVADRLGDLKVPFLFATGYGEQAVLPDIHQHRTVVQKPYTIEGIARVLEELVA